MSANILDLAVTQFTDLLETKIQQQTSAMRPYVASGSHKGKLASPVNYMGPIKAQVPEGRFAPKKRQDATFERRWVSPLDRDLNQLIDTFDELRLISDPKSQYSTNAAYAVAREWDDQLINAAFADAQKGTDINTLSTETFASSLPDATTPEIAVNFNASASTGLTTAKLKELKKKLRHYAQDGNLDDAQVTIVIGSQQEADLLGQVEVISQEYNERPVLVDGVIKRFLGFNFILSERLQYASNVRSVIAFMKSGLYLGVWNEMETTPPARRKDLSGEPWDLYTMFTCGTTRLQAGKVWRVKCADTTGASITP